MSGKMSDEVFEKFAIASPMATLGMIAARAIFSNRQLDKIFQDASSRQYTKNVAFSTCAKLLGEVALLGTPSVNNAYTRVNADIPVSISAIYQKLRNVEPKVCEALVGVTATKAANLIHTLEATRQELKDQRTVTAIVITRDKPLKSRKSQVVLFTNLLVSKELAVSQACLYLKRWKVEEAFRQLTE